MIGCWFLWMKPGTRHLRGITLILRLEAARFLARITRRLLSYGANFAAPSECAAPCRRPRIHRCKFFRSFSFLQIASFRSLWCRCNKQDQFFGGLAPDGR